MSRKRLLSSAMITIGFLWAPPGLQAQACLGLPQGSRGGFAFSLGFPEHGKTYGITGTGSREDGNLYVGASFAISHLDFEEVENEELAGGRVAYEISALGPGTSFCPTFGASYAWIEDLLHSWTVPLGLGLGKTMRVEGGETALTPYIIPQLFFVETSLAHMIENDWYFVLEGGATFSFTKFYFGGFVSRAFKEGADVLFGAQVGLPWR